MAESPVETRPDRSYVPWYRRLIPRPRTVVVGLLIILALPFAIRWYRLSRLPDVPLPFDVEEFTAIDFPPEENAYYYFNQIPPSIGPNNSWYSDFANEGEKRFRQGELTAWNDVPAEVQAVVLQHQPAIQLLRDGSHCEESNYIPPQTYSWVTLIPTVQNLRDAQRLLVLDVIRRLDAGDLQGAREMLQDAFRASRHVGRRGCQIERYVGIWMHAVVMPGWHQWSRQPQVTVADLESALEQLHSDWRLTAPASDQQKIEVIMMLTECRPPMAGLCDQLSQRMNQTLSRATGNENRAAQSMSFLSKNLPGWERPLLWLLAEPDVSARAAKLWLTQELQHCDQPLSSQPPQLPGRLGVYDSPEKTAGLDSRALNSRLNASMFSESMMRRELFKRQQLEAARQTLLETEMRLQILFRTTNSLGWADDEHLLAEFAWPIDPCDPSQGEILHRLNESTLVIWSRGLDGIDDDGDDGPPFEEGDLIVTISWPTSGNDTASDSPLE